MGFDLPTPELAVLLAGLVVSFVRWPNVEAGVPKAKTGTRHRSARTLDQLLEEQATLAAKEVSEQQFLQGYGEFLAAGGANNRPAQPRTVETNMQTLRQWFNHLKARRKKWSQVNRRNAKKLLDDFLEREKVVQTKGKTYKPTGAALHDSTRHKDEGVLLRAYDWAAGEGGLLKVNPFAGRRRMKRPAHAQRFVERADVRKLMDAAASDDQRMLVMLSLAFWPAFRAGGIADAKCEDVRRHTREIAVRGKGDGGAITGWVPIAPQLAEVLLPWMGNRRSGPLIPSLSRPTRHISAKAVSRLIAEFMKAHGVDESAHGLRASAANEIDALAPDPRAAQRLLLHKRLETTVEWYLLDASLRMLWEATLARPGLEHDLPVGLPDRAQRAGQARYFHGLGARAHPLPRPATWPGHETLRTVPNPDPP